VPEIGEEIAGYLLASVSRHPAMPGVTGDLEELRPARARRGCAEAEARRSRHRLDASAGRGVIATKVGLEAPWTEKELAFWGSLGFENDTTEVTRYFSDGCD